MRMEALEARRRPFVLPWQRALLADPDHMESLAIHMIETNFPGHARDRLVQAEK